MDIGSLFLFIADAIRSYEYTTICFQVWAVMNKTDMSILIQIFFEAMLFLLGKYVTSLG